MMSCCVNIISETAFVSVVTTAVSEEVSSEGGVKGCTQGLDAESCDNSTRCSSQQSGRWTAARAHHQPVPREGGGES